MDDKMDELLQISQNKKTSLKQSRKLINARNKMNAICRALTMNTQEYDPQKTVESINTYVNSRNKLDRILYSEISSYVFLLNIKERGAFATNIDTLLNYSLNNENLINEDCRKIIIKIYDHFQLTLHQIENANNIFVNSIEDAKENLQNQIRAVEKEYISILGIFAAIVLAFVGGITFSSSVLQNIANVSVYRLLIVIDLLGMVLINTIYILIKFIFIINNKEEINLNIGKINIGCMIFALIVFLLWIVSIDQLPVFLKNIIW